MGFWKTLFGGESDAEEEKKNADERNFDLLKYDGVKAMRIGQFEYAAKCFEKALETKNDPEVRDYLSRAYLSLGKNAEALDELKKVIAEEPENVNIILQAASTAYIMEDYAEMEALCEKALAAEPDNAMAHLFYARCELGMEKLVEAIARLTKAIALDDNLAMGHLLRGQTLLRMGNLAGTEEDVKWLEENSNVDEDILLLHARMERAKGCPEEAIAMYGKVIDTNPFCIEAFRERGSLRMEQGDKKGAEEDMKMVLELNPQEMADVSGEYSAEGIEQKTRQAYSNLNPFGI